MTSCKILVPMKWDAERIKMTYPEQSIQALRTGESVRKEQDMEKQTLLYFVPDSVLQRRKTQISDSIIFFHHFEQSYVVQLQCFIVVTHKHTQQFRYTNSLLSVFQFSHYPKVSTSHVPSFLYFKNLIAKNLIPNPAMYSLILYHSASHLPLLISISIQSLDCPCSSVPSLLLFTISLVTCLFMTHFINFY